jgi:hypothetical protein
MKLALTEKDKDKVELALILVLVTAVTIAVITMGVPFLESLGIRIPFETIPHQ